MIRTVFILTASMVAASLVLALIIDGIRQAIARHRAIQRRLNQPSVRTIVTTTNPAINPPAINNAFKVISERPFRSVGMPRGVA